MRSKASFFMNIKNLMHFYLIALDASFSYRMRLGENAIRTAWKRMFMSYFVISNLFSFCSIVTTTFLIFKMFFWKMMKYTLDNFLEELALQFNFVCSFKSVSSFFRPFELWIQSFSSFIISIFVVNFTSRFQVIIFWIFTYYQ